MTNSEIELNYKPNLTLVNAAYFELFAEKAMPRALSVAIWVMFFLVLLIAFHTAQLFQQGSAVLGAIVGAVVMLGATNFRQRRLQQKISKHFDDSTSWTFQADAHEVRLFGANGKGQIPWTAVQTIRECRNGVAIVLASTIIVIPTDALPEGMVVQDFCETLNQLRASK